MVWTISNHVLSGSTPKASLLSQAVNLESLLFFRGEGSSPFFLSGGDSQLPGREVAAAGRKLPGEGVAGCSGIAVGWPGPLVAVPEEGG